MGAAGGAEDPGMMGSFNQAVLEVNPTHPIVLDLERMIAGTQGDAESAEATNFAVLLYDVAALTSGYDIEDSGDFAGRILSMMTSKATTDVKDAEFEADIPEPTPSTTEAQIDFFGLSGNVENV